MNNRDRGFQLWVLVLIAVALGRDVPRAWRWGAREVHRFIAWMPWHTVVMVSVGAAVLSSIAIVRTIRLRRRRVRQSS